MNTLELHKAVSHDMWNKKLDAMTAFCDRAPCSFVEVDRRYRGAHSLRYQHPDDGGSAYLCKHSLEA
jgi:hypothetical protein